MARNRTVKRHQPASMRDGQGKQIDIRNLPETGDLGSLQLRVV
jgi:hypothetical protein